MIELTKYERLWIRLFKGHFQDKYPYAGNWTLTSRPLFEEIYGYTVSTNTQTYLNCLHDTLLTIYLKIVEPETLNSGIKAITLAAIRKQLPRDDDNSVVRVIEVLAGFIQANPVKGRYVLTLPDIHE